MDSLEARVVLAQPLPGAVVADLGHVDLRLLAAQLERLTGNRITAKSLGRAVEIAWQAGEAGDYYNVTWPGTVGTLTSMAPGRFCNDLAGVWGTVRRHPTWTFSFAKSEWKALACPSVASRCSARLVALDWPMSVAAESAVAPTEGSEPSSTKATWAEPDGIVVVDTKGVPLIFNEGAERILGYSAEEVIGHPEVLERYGSFRGKGEALWKSLYETSGDIVVWADTDVRNWHPRMVYGTVGPLLHEPRLQPTQRRQRDDYQQRYRREQEAHADRLRGTDEHPRIAAREQHRAPQVFLHQRPENEAEAECRADDAVRIARAEPSDARQAPAAHQSADHGTGRVHRPPRPERKLIHHHRVEHVAPVALSVRLLRLPEILAAARARVAPAQD